MIWPFKNKKERVLEAVKLFEQRLLDSFVPLLKKPKMPVQGNGAFLAMVINISMDFVAIRNFKVYEKVAPYVISHAATAYGTMVAIGSQGKVGVEEAINRIIREMELSQEMYSAELVKSSSRPEAALQGCLDIFLDRSAGWAFKSEVDRAQAVIILSQALSGLMSDFKSIFRASQ